MLPRIKIQTIEQITLTQPDGPAVIALIGTAQWGEVNVVKTFTSYANLLNHYKSDAENLTLVKGANIAYNNGAFIVKAVRIADASKRKSSHAFDGANATTDVLTFNGKYEGVYGDNILVTIFTKGTGRTVSITDGVVIENFTNSNAVNGYTTNQSIATAINEASSLVSVSVKTGSETANLVDSYVATALIGGNNGANLVFSNVVSTFDNLLNLVDFDILLVPGFTDNSNHTILSAKLETRAENERKYAIYVTGVTANESISTQTERNARSSRLVLCSPSIYYTPIYQTTPIILDGSYLACAVAGQIARRDVEVSPTRRTVSVEGLIVDSTTLQKYYNNGEMIELLESGITPVSNIHGSLKIARGVTRIADTSSIYYEINIQRIVDFIKKQIQEKLDGFLGNPNLLRIRDVMAREADGILQQNMLDEIIVAYLPTEITEGVSPDTVNVLMTIRPTFAINFINVTLAITRL